MSMYILCCLSCSRATVSSLPPSLSCVSLQRLMSRSGRNSGRLPRANWRRMKSTQRNNSHTLQWRMANRVRSGQAATPAAKHLWGYRESETCVCVVAICDLGHFMINCRYFGETPNRDEIAGMEDRAVRWMNAVADTIWMNEVVFVLDSTNYTIKRVL